MRQGTLGAQLFALSVHPVINRIQNKYSDMTVLVYLDDIFVIAPGSQVDYLLTDFKADLKICDHRCDMYSPSLNNDNCFSIPLASSGVDILGVPVGSDSYIQAKHSEIAASGESLCSQLHASNDPQSAMLSLRYCRFPQ